MKFNSSRKQSQPSRINSNTKIKKKVVHSAMVRKQSMEISYIYSKLRSMYSNLQ